MTEVDDALFDKLAGDGTLAGLVGMYRGQVKVFTQSQIPEGVTGRYVVIGPSPSTVPHDTKTSVGVNHIRQIECFAPADGNPSNVDAIAGRVWGILHRQPLNVEGWKNNIIEASGPMVAPTDKTLYGRLVMVRLTLYHWPH
jgi:hypothetical protein